MASTNSEIAEQGGHAGGHVGGHAGGSLERTRNLCCRERAKKRPAQGQNRISSISAFILTGQIVYCYSNLRFFPSCYCSLILFN